MDVDYDQEERIETEKPWLIAAASLKCLTYELFH